MDKELAQMVVMSALRARVELGDLMPLLRQRGEEGEDGSVKDAIASAVYEIGLVVERIFDQHPALKDETESRLSKYGRSYY